ncbi:ABC transporter permease [Hymenobacter sp. BT175]|uniref:ABC transporter permease n=1 Tax=Hymenobacter translucens TaxID=2886507 RepID=UPI001D0F0D60|nr:FtsX-like permease family protein [Hymenobacter translucens]MCC2547312.1 ABC transporter permease [Hymenobacter translucens]
MLRHLFTLIWNRKRSNFLLITEIVLSFFVLFVVSSLLVSSYYNYRQPMGFDYTNVWEFDLNPGQDTASRKETLRLLKQHLRATPGVVAVTHATHNSPFSFSNMNTDQFRYKGRIPSQTEWYEADDEMARVMKLNVVAGRWFDRRDENSGQDPVIINQKLADELFVDEAPVGKYIDDKSSSKKWLVVGVIDAYRAGSDMAANEPALFYRRPLEDTAKSKYGYDGPVLLVRVQPGSGAILEQQLVKDIKQVSKGWDATVNSLEENRRDKMKIVLTPLTALGLVALFLIINVALGLFGVLWYNINQRKAEIGLRRAMGATGAGISKQFLGEMLVVTTLGVVAGLLLTVQFPLLDAFGLGTEVYGLAMLATTVLVYLLTAVCALQPSRQAAGIQPAVALREE